MQYAVLSCLWEFELLSACALQESRPGKYLAGDQLTHGDLAVFVRLSTLQSGWLEGKTRLTSSVSGTWQAVRLILSRALRLVLADILCQRMRTAHTSSRYIAFLA